MIASERKRLQRRRDRSAGWVEITVKVDERRVGEVREFVASLPPPPPPTDPNQLSLLEELDALLRGEGDDRQPSLL